MTISNKWLPEGKHWGLNISRFPRPDAGSFLPGSAPKMVLHTTEGTDFVAMRNVLVSKRAEPHFLISADARHVVQFIALNRTSKALEHPPGTPETNHAHCIQIEICGFAKDSQNWTAAKMNGIAALCCLIEHRVNIERHAHVSFQNPRRIAAGRFADHRGYLGHVHVPNNSHWDPGKFRISELFERMAEQEAKHH